MSLRAIAGLVGGLGQLVASGGYAEGTFTPTVVGSTTAGVGTYTVQQGNYTRIGNRCFFNLVVVWSATTGTGNLQIGGLPFTSNAAANSNSGAAIGFFDGTDTAQSYLARIGSGSTQILIQTHIASTGIAALALPASANLNIAGSYLL